ncbi:MAG: peptide ABC transporter substrate-binding protein [Anaerolineae bacterium]|nr:peptide ABC transporter substrate-binding protein [Anaerolineae bacterium]
MLPGFAVSGAQTPKTLRVVLGATGTAVEWDVARAMDVTSVTFITMMYPSLVPRNELTAEPQHGMATAWTISEDFRTYTFTIKQGVPWVVYDFTTGQVAPVTDAAGHVRYVTAHDFVYGTLRTMDPATRADYGYMAAQWIAGGDAFYKGEGRVEDVQIAALDDYTLQITAPEPAGFLLQVYGMWVFTAQPQWAIERYGAAWTLPGNYPSYGSFVLKSYAPGARVVVVKNPYWPGTESHPIPEIDVIEARMLAEAVALVAFETGEVDVIETVSSSALDRLRVERPDELYFGPSDCTYYYGFNVEKPPVDNVHLRRALSLAIDREKLVATVTKGGQQPAGFFTLPTFAASPTQAEYPDLGIHSDPQQAQAELALYFAETGTTTDTMPPLTLTHNINESHTLVAQSVQRMWRETLGIEVKIESQEWRTYLDLLATDAPQIWRLGWCADYPDPNSFLGSVFHSKFGSNNTNWRNEEFDALIDKAARLLDTQQRRDLYARAEHILTWEDAAIAPIYFYATQSLISDQVTFTPSILGIQRYDKWHVQ